MSNPQSIPGAGDIVLARPWNNGTELDSRRGIVLSDWNGNREYLLVWFPDLGEIGSIPAGASEPQPVQAIMAAKARPAGHVGALDDQHLVNIYALVTGHAEAADLAELLAGLVADIDTAA